MASTTRRLSLAACLDVRLRCRKRRSSRLLQWDRHASGLLCVVAWHQRTYCWGNLGRLVPGAFDVTNSAHVSSTRSYSNTVHVWLPSVDAAPAVRHRAQHAATLRVRWCTVAGWGLPWHRGACQWQVCPPRRVSGNSSIASRAVSARHSHGHGNRKARAFTRDMACGRTRTDTTGPGGAYIRGTRRPSRSPAAGKTPDVSVCAPDAQLHLYSAMCVWGGFVHV